MNEYTPDDVLIMTSWDEVRGLLLDVDEVKSRFVFENFVVHLGPLGFECLSHVRNLIGEKVCIIRTDVEGHQYIARIDRARGGGVHRDS